MSQYKIALIGRERWISYWSGDKKEEIWGLKDLIISALCFLSFYFNKHKMLTF